jgi:hypothetical protein
VLNQFGFGLTSDVIAGIERAQERASNAPRPQSSRALTDILDQRLDAIDKHGPLRGSWRANLIANGPALNIGRLQRPPTS